MNIHGIEVYGNSVDHKTRCAHYHSEKDIIAIKFYCCQKYYPCISCHQETGCSGHEVWPKDQFDEKAILCGSCGTDLSINDYLQCKSICPSCLSAFNPGCSLHAHYYFDIR